MYEQTRHGQPSPWVPDFNSVGVRTTATAGHLAKIGKLDTLVSPRSMPDVPVEAITALGVDHVQVHRVGLGEDRVRRVVRALSRQGWTVVTADSSRTLLRSPRP